MLWHVMAAKIKSPPKRRKRQPAPSGDDQAQVKTAQQIDLKANGLKYFAMLAPLLEHLHDDQCERDKAGNRKLHYDQYCMLVMLYVLKRRILSPFASTAKTNAGKPPTESESAAPAAENSKSSQAPPPNGAGVRLHCGVLLQVEEGSV